VLIRDRCRSGVFIIKIIQRLCVHPIQSAGTNVAAYISGLN
jgi:hypothetical protein